MSKMYGFIELTLVSRTQGINTDGSTRYGTEKDKALVNLSDIARVQFGGIVFNKPFGNGDYFCRVEESYQEIKELIKKSSEI